MAMRESLMSLILTALVNLAKCLVEHSSDVATNTVH